MSNFYEQQIKDLQDKNNMLEQEKDQLKKNWFNSDNELLQQKIKFDKLTKENNELTKENNELKLKIETIKESNNMIKYHSIKIDNEFSEDIINTHYTKEFNNGRKRRFF